jgi:hypothetical protein
MSPETERAGLASALSLPGAWYRSVPVAALFALLGAVQAAEAYALANRVPYSGSALSAVYEQIELNLLPEAVGPWKRPAKLEVEKRETGNPMGEFSRVWRYANGPVQCAVSLDYPYPEFHDLRVCYNNIGWRLDETEAFVQKPEQGLPLHCVRVKMERPVERYASLWFCEFDQDGVGVDPTGLGELKARGLVERVSWRVSFESTRWQRVFNPSVTTASSGLGSILQVQLFIQTYQPLSDGVRSDLERLFVESAERLRAKCLELKTKKG